ncbi:MAG: hypothetical protein KJ789_06090, partial [Alphaproteobacteria bacterium]|nr:hypothetical protein [Alphaproteobacteria bacterium]
MGLNRRSLLIGSASGAGIVALGLVGLRSGSFTSSAVEPLPRDESFPKLPIGMNLAGIADWEPGFPFKNLFLGARPWTTRNLSGTGPHNTKAQAAFRYDDDGYPIQVPVAFPGAAEP